MGVVHLNLLSSLSLGFLILKKRQMQEMSITETTVRITMMIIVWVLLLFPAKPQISSDQISRCWTLDLLYLVESWHASWNLAKLIFLLQSNPGWYYIFHFLDDSIESLSFLIKKKLGVVWANINGINFCP